MKKNMGVAAAAAPLMAGHTPGPWSAIDRVVCTTIELNGSATWLAACNVGGCSRDEQTANARLIAAAPELLAALEKAEEWLSGWASAEPYIDIISEAIAKAKREAT